LTFPPNTVPAGCTVTIEEQTSEGNYNCFDVGYLMKVKLTKENLLPVTDSYKDDKCSDLAPKSPIWSINLVGCSGKDKLTGDIQIDFLGLSGLISISDGNWHLLSKLDRWFMHWVSTRRRSVDGYAKVELSSKESKRSNHSRSSLLRLFCSEQKKKKKRQLNDEVSMYSSKTNHFT